MAGFDLNSLLNGKSKGTAVQTQGQAAGPGPAEVQESTFEIAMIDVEDLMPRRDNFYTTEGIDELADAIELSGGIEQNLVVRPEAHGKYEVIAGHRRRLAALKLVGEGKEEYRKVPCRIKHESDSIEDKLSLILTNSTARELSDWEKVQQAKELKEILTEYKKALKEENREKVKMGRMREIVAQMLNTSTTQIGRMEAIDNNLSNEFKQEMEKGNINISTAHELSRLDGEGQKKAYEQYGEKGELHIKDVKQEQKEEITDEQAEQAQRAILDAIKGEANRAVFNDKDTTGIEKTLRKHFEKSFKGSKVEQDGGGHFIYRFSAVGMTLIDEAWKNYLIEYTDLAEIVSLMIENGDLVYDDTPEEVQEEEKTDSGPQEEEFSDMNEPTAAGREQEEDNEQLPGQQDMSKYTECVPEPQEKNLSFTEWIARKYGIGQYNAIRNEVRNVIVAEDENGEKYLKEWEERITNALSVWVMDKTKEYQKYLQGQAVQDGLQ